MHVMSCLNTKSANITYHLTATLFLKILSLVQTCALWSVCLKRVRIYFIECVRTYPGVFSL